MGAARNDGASMWHSNKSLKMICCLILTLACGQLVLAEIVDETMVQDNSKTGTSTMTDMPASDAASGVVEKYFSLMREGDINVIELFHPEALLLGLGMRTKGRDAIKQFYTNAIATGGPQPRNAGPLLSDGSRVAAEIYIDLSDGSTLHVIDLFTVKEGRIVSLNYFLADEPSAE